MEKSVAVFIFTKFNMTELEFRKLLREAMNEFYKDIPDPEELEYEYTFSEKFQSNMQKMMHENGFPPKVASVSERKYQNRRYIIRKMAIAILVAVLMLALAACAVYFLEIHWNEKQMISKEQWMLLLILSNQESIVMSLRESIHGFRTALRVQKRKCILGCCILNM